MKIEVEVPDNTKDGEYVLTAQVIIKNGVALHTGLMAFPNVEDTQW